MLRKSAPERFWVKVDNTGDCWEWTGARYPHGYGKFGYSAHTTLSAHRYAYELVRGEIPSGLQIDHLCRNRGCVNPSHLEAVTQQENCRRAGLAVTHCPRGHQYTVKNTYIQQVASGRSMRSCRTCRNTSKTKRVHQIDMDVTA